MTTWYYQNRRGDYYEIADTNDDVSPFFKKQLFAYKTDSRGRSLEGKHVCRLDFKIERVYFSDYPPDSLEKVFFRWGATKIAKELEKQNPLDETEFITYDKVNDLNFTKDNWFLKFSKLCSYQKKEGNLLKCSICHSTEYKINESICENCIVPDDFRRCKYLIPSIKISKTLTTPYSMYILDHQCRLGKEIDNLLTCLPCTSREPIFLTKDCFSTEEIITETKEIKEIKVEEIKKIQEKRFLFLKKLCDVTKWDPSQHAKMYDDIGKPLGFDEDTVKDIERYLRDEGLLQWSTGGYINITHLGVVEVERALTRPKEPTEHFPSNINIISIQHMEQSQIIQDSPGAKQVVSITQEESIEIQEVLKLLKGSVDKLNLGEQTKNDFNINIQTMELQMSASQPKRGIIADCLGSIKNILEGTASSVLASQLLQKVVPLLTTLS